MIRLCKTATTPKTRVLPLLQYLDFKSLTPLIGQVTEQMRPRFQTKTNLEGPKETEAETSSRMLLVAKDFVESTQFLLPIQKVLLGR